MQIDAAGMGDVLTTTVCRARDLSALPVDQQAVCTAAYGEGLRQSMAATILFFIPAGAFYLLAASTLKKDLVAKPV
jgi:hypothetical protein